MNEIQRRLIRDMYVLATHWTLGEISHVAKRFQELDDFSLEEIQEEGYRIGAELNSGMGVRATCVECGRTWFQRGNMTHTDYCSTDCVTDSIDNGRFKYD